MINHLLTLAMAPPAGGGAEAQQSPYFMFGWLGLMILIFYFMLIRPQQRREKDRRALMDSLKSGDRVSFCGGMLGIVTNVKEKTAIVKIADGVKIEVARSAVNTILDKSETTADESKK